MNSGTVSINSRTFSEGAGCIQSGRKSLRRQLAVVTVDVEPDNVWGDFRSSSLKNIAALPRFQELCSRYGVRPTYLVCYSVASDNQCCSVLEQFLKNGACEVGAHPHMWEIPPHVKLDSTATPANLYPIEAVEEKLSSLTQLLHARFGPMTSHRAGRWGFVADHAGPLAKLGYGVDTSVTPGIDWSSTGAPNFRAAGLAPAYWKQGSVLEVPCTVRPALVNHRLARSRFPTATMRRAGLGASWLRCRPDMTAKKMVQVSDWASRTLGFLNVMTHSSELCAGASPLWRTEEAVSAHLRRYEELFGHWVANGVETVTLQEFAMFWRRTQKKIKEQVAVNG
ncbi:MAG TPA: hypothetical protein VGW37_19495 [Terriglobia bacterium]|nr:hypothetical protein [Terriglobia bacterium]